MSLSEIACSLPASPTLALNEQARVLREKGEAVINLGIGEPKNKAPINAILGATTILSGGDVKYGTAAGTVSLRKAITQYTEENYGWTVSPANVIVSSGAKQSLFNILFTLCNSGDEVLVLAPYWVSYPEMIRLVGAKPIIVLPNSETLIPEFNDIERVVSPRTKAIIVNSPNNPSGRVFPEELIAKLVHLCETRDIYMICDDIYHKLVFDGIQATPATKFARKGADIENTRLILVNGVAKTYGMTGFRIGWAVASKKLVTIMSNVQSQTITCVSPVMQAGAEGALLGAQTGVETLRLAIQNNRDVLMEKMLTIPKIKCNTPEGTFYAFPDFSAYNNDANFKNSEDLSSFLLKKVYVVTVPGKEFGMDGFLRISYAGNTKDIIEGMERIRWVLDPTTPKEINIGKHRITRDWI